MPFSGTRSRGLRGSQDVDAHTVSTRLRRIPPPEPIQQHMAQYQVTCIHKPHRNSVHEHITHIGGGVGANRWRIGRDEAIRQIEGKISSFFVVDPQNPHKISWVGVVHPAFGHPYLRTYADGDWNNNLLSLAECTL